jgi:hypothetical protein
MLGNIIVYVIIGLVLILTGRSLYRILTGRSDGCRCEGGGCPFSGSCNNSLQKVELQERINAK